MSIVLARERLQKNKQLRRHLENWFLVLSTGCPRVAARHMVDVWTFMEGMQQGLLVAAYSPNSELIWFLKELKEEIYRMYKEHRRWY